MTDNDRLNEIIDQLNELVDESENLEGYGGTDLEIELDMMEDDGQPSPTPDELAHIREYVERNAVKADSIDTRMRDLITDYMIIASVPPHRYDFSRRYARNWHDNI